MIFSTLIQNRRPAHQKSVNTLSLWIIKALCLPAKAGYEGSNFVAFARRLRLSLSCPL